MSEVNFCNGGGLGVEVPSQSNGPGSTTPFVVLGEGEIFVEDTTAFGLRTIKIKRVVYTPPSIVVTDNPLKEVGELVDFTWNVTINKGRDNITARVINPVPIPSVDLTLPFNVSVEDFTQVTKGTKTAYTVSVTDTSGTTVVKQLAIKFANKVIVGFSSKDGKSSGQLLTATDLNGFTKTLATDIKSVYGGTKSYTVPSSAVPLYIYFAYELGTDEISTLTEGPLPVPLEKSISNVTMNNQYGIPVTYKIVRLQNALESGVKTFTMS